MVLQSLSKTDWNVQTKCVPIQVSVRCDPKQIPKLVFKPNLNLLCGCLSHTGLKSSSWATGCNPGQAKSNQCLGFVVQLIPIIRFIISISIFYLFHIYYDSMTRRHQLQLKCLRNILVMNHCWTNILFRIAKLQPLADTKLPIASTEACRTSTFTSWRWLLMAHLWEETGGEITER